MLPEPGKKAPLFTLFDDSGSKTAFGDFKGRYVVLYFYPKDMTPGCTIESLDFNRLLEKFARLNCAVLGLSKDPPARHQAFKKKYQLNFPLLSDETGSICEKYGVWQEKSFCGKKFMGIVRSTFIVDPSGNIVKAYPKVRVRGHAEKVLNDLNELIAGG